MKNRKTLLLFICFLLISASSFSQPDKPRKKKQKDPVYETRDHKAKALYLVLPYPYLKLVFRDVKSANHLDFEPTPHYNLGIGIKLRGFNLTLGTGLSFFKQNQVGKGKTKYKDIQIQFNTKRFSYDFCYQSYKGFYIKNTADYVNTPFSDLYLLRPDIGSMAIVLNSIYIFNNKKFSFKNAFGFNETKTKSAGSVLAGIYYSLFTESGDSGIISGEFKPFFNPDYFIDRCKEQTLGMNIGYAYTLVVAKRINFTFAFTEGAGIYKINYRLENGTTYLSPGKLSVKTSLRFNVGYEMGKFFLGAMSTYDNYYFLSNSNSAINFTNGKVRLFAGYRLGKKKK